MGRQLLALAALTMVLVAAAPREPGHHAGGCQRGRRIEPRASSHTRAAVAALNATLEKIVALQADAPKSTEVRRPHMHEAVKARRDHQAARSRAEGRLP